MSLIEEISKDVLYYHFTRKKRNFYETDIFLINKNQK